MWVRLDDSFATHHKLIAAGPLAMALQVRAICYARHQRTDGWIPTPVIPSLIFDLPTDRDWPAYMQQHHLWDRRDDGEYEVHDFLDWNPSTKELDLVKERQAKGGKKGMKSRWKDHKPDHNSTYNSTYNSPNKSPDKSLILSDVVLNTVSNPSSSEPEFEQFWSAYPKKVGKKDAQRAWAKAKDRPDIAVLLEAIGKQTHSEQWRKEAGQFIPNPATWLNRGSWADEPIQVNGQPVMKTAVIPPFPPASDPIARGLWRKAYGDPDAVSG